MEWKVCPAINSRAQRGCVPRISRKLIAISQSEWDCSGAHIHTCHRHMGPRLGESNAQAHIRLAGAKVIAWWCWQKGKERKDLRPASAAAVLLTYASASKPEHILYQWMCEVYIESITFTLGVGVPSLVVVGGKRQRRCFTLDKLKTGFRWSIVEILEWAWNWKQNELARWWC